LVRLGQNGEIQVAKAKHKQPRLTMSYARQLKAWPCNKMLNFFLPKWHWPQAQLLLSHVRYALPSWQ